MAIHKSTEIIKVLEWVRDYDIPEIGDIIKSEDGKDIPLPPELLLVKSTISNLIDFIKAPIIKSEKQILNLVGRHRSSPESKFDAKELKMGIDVEKEHSDDPNVAVEIAKDHLAEIPDYYSRLKVMEEKDFWKKYNKEK